MCSSFTYTFIYTCLHHTTLDSNINTYFQANTSHSSSHSSLFSWTNKVNICLLLISNSLCKINNVFFCGWFKIIKRRKYVQITYKQLTLTCIRVWGDHAGKKLPNFQKLFFSSNEVLSACSGWCCGILQLCNVCKRGLGLYGGWTALQPINI